MIVKAMALICSLTPTGHACNTEIFDWTFQDVHSCEVRLREFRIYEIPKLNKKLVLDDCVVTSYN